MKDESNTNTKPFFVDYKNEEDLLKRKVSFHWWNSLSTTLHTHNHYEFFLITKGQISHSLNGITTKIGENCLYLIRPCDVHQFNDNKDLSCMHINLSFTMEKFAQLTEALNIDGEKLLQYPNLHTILTEGEMQYFLTRASHLSVSPDRRLERDDSFFSSICELLAFALSIIYRRTVYNENSYPDWFSQLITAINDPANCDLTAEKLCRLSSYSPPILIKYFKRYTGLNVVQYLTRSKVNAAKRLLASSDFSVLQICGRLGYDSESHFIKVFKQIVGQTPTKYRQNLKIYFT